MLCLSWEGGKKSDNRIVTVDKIQVGLMPEREEECVLKKLE